MLSIIIVNKNENGDIICSVDDFKKIINDTYNDGYMRGCQENILQRGARRLTMSLITGSLIIKTTE